ncbi:hypothetical protein CEN49_21495 [Fischerella thermalis CCMEE 5273]|nr:hypothetical protein CEN49_21495 [Fischerella thermalis CCMEE 5273]
MYGSEDQAKKRFSVLSSTINDRSTEQPLSRWGNSSRQVDWLKEESHTFKVWECQTSLLLPLVFRCMYPSLLNQFNC